MGTPGRSNALAIAQRLGMPERILDRARQSAPTETASMEQLLGELQQERDAIADQVRAERIAREEAETIRASLAERRDAIEAERDAVLSRAERAMEDELANFRRNIRAGLKELDRQRSREQAETLAERRDDDSRERLQTVRRERANSRRRRADATTAASPFQPERLAAGDFVYLRGLPEPGEVLTAVEDGALDVQLGALRTRVRVEQIERLAPAGVRSKDEARPLRGMHATVASLPRPPVDPGSKIDLRGRVTDEALPMVDSFLDVAIAPANSASRSSTARAPARCAPSRPRPAPQTPAGHHLRERRAKQGGDGVTIVTLVG